MDRTQALTALWPTLTDRPLDTLRVMQSDITGFSLDAGLARDYWFREDGPGDVPNLQVGEARGEDAERSCFNWWTVFLGGEVVAELRDTGLGYTLYTKIEEAYA